jgi:uncharacterized membrane protein
MLYTDVTLITSHRLLLCIFGCIGLAACYLFVRDEKAGEQCEDGTCSVLGHTPYARLLGVPNWYFGILFYAAIIIVGIANISLVTLFGLAGSVLSIVFSIILVWSLIVKLKTFCRYCYVSHATNLAIFITLILSLKR